MHAAFTLIELLCVLVVLGVLSALVVGAGQRAHHVASVAEAKTELAALAAGLEAYKRQHGEYPQTGSAANDPLAAAAAANDGPGILFNALSGLRAPLGGGLDERTPAYVELARLTLQNPYALPSAAEAGPFANAFVDPWGRRYLYSSHGSASGRTRFVLYSVGRDGVHRSPDASTGAVDLSCPENADNLYAHP
ncbi:MAG TPA: type II secretion system protein GspG [Opitutus sp.]|nr:type II secretion system protein GspG [Opitutus sp.]